MKTEQWQAYMETKEWYTKLCDLYSEKNAEAQKQRYRDLSRSFSEIFGTEIEGIRAFSSPGRTEIGGNHTDHNYGKVLTGSIDLDTICFAAPTDDGVFRIHDVTYKEDFSLSIDDTDKRPGERGAIALVRGILKGFSDRGLRVGGLRACVTSSVISAAGVSSSASFEMLVCAILDHFHNNGSVPKSTYALIGQSAENVYWDKKSGLLDQTACAVGGLVTIDFENPIQPALRKLDKDFSDYGYSLVIVNTGGNHADLSEDYSAIPTEMKAVAACFGKSVLREITLEELMTQAASVRAQTGDRAVLRALHFLEENERVDREVAALDRNDFPAFLREITSSGDSSWKWLQNCYCPGEVKEQEIVYALALTDLYIRKKDIVGACRVHGGGFAGVIMAILPKETTADYMSFICNAGMTPYLMNVRKQGAVAL